MIATLTAIGTWLATSRMGQFFGAIGVGMMIIFGAYGYGRVKEKQAEKARREKQIAKQIETRRQVDENISRMSDDDVRSRLRRDARD